LTQSARIARYWHTLRHLKPVQFHGRLWFRLRRPRADLRAAPALRAPAGNWQTPARRTPSMTGARRFRFLNEDGGLDGGWDDGARPKLWLYNLHYFDDLNAEDPAARDVWHTALMDDWIHHHPPGGGNGWEPYPASLRIVNWIKRHLDGRPLTPGQRDSLAVQVRWLMQRLEWHLLGNHLFANAKALVLAGLLFEGTQADHWLTKGLGIIADQLPEQVLADGGNFERSPMYHAIFLEDMLDLINAAQVFPGRIPAPTVAFWRTTATRMVAWLRAMCHPDGEISLFNDAALGIAPSPTALVSYATGLGVPLPPIAALAEAPAMTALQESGYIRVEDKQAVALLDVAPVGPDYLPGHAHADTLSFELSVFGQRLVVNGGTSCYGLDAERLRQRGTAAHSTLVIDGQDSSEVWGGFRVARRARPVDLVTATDAQGVVVACSHDGYRRLPGQPVHRREWSFRSGGVQVHDSVGGRFSTAEARYHFHPEVRVAADGTNALLLTLPRGEQARLRVRRGSLRLEASRYAPAFGQLKDNLCAVVSADDAQMHVDLDWT
jgi:uncharacterized heparinase superfamily protein